MSSAKTQVAAIVQIANAICEVVEEFGEEFVPEGIVYGALIGFGITLDQYQDFIKLCVDSGRIKRGPMSTLCVGTV